MARLHTTRFGIAFVIGAALLGLIGPPTWARAQSTGGLGSTQLAQLHSQPLPILAPAYVPPGFRLVHVDAMTAKKDHTNGYTLKYRSSDGREFIIDVADGGFGDADPDLSSFRRPFTVDSSVVGSIKMSPYQVTVGGQPRWTYSSDYRSLERLGNPRAMLIFSGTNMSADDLRRIYSSLRVISR